MLLLLKFRYFGSSNKPAPLGCHVALDHEDERHVENGSNASDSEQDDMNAHEAGGWTDWIVFGDTRRVSVLANVEVGDQVEDLDDGHDQA